MPKAAYVDVHAHLTDPRFGDDLDQVVARAEAAGLDAIIVNGLEPQSNRAVLAMANRHRIVKPALGIYPIDAVCDRLPPGLPFPVARFDIEAELGAIEAAAAAGLLAAIGECGLDGHWVGQETFPRQDEVFERLIHIAQTHALPLIIHTRKLEERAASILRNQRVTRVNFHCFGGRTAWAKRWAEEDGWWFSIPANATVNEAFRKMLKTLPLERLLTETDCPYLPPRRGERNEPANVVGTVALLAELRGMTVDEAATQVATNFTTLFGSRWLQT